MNFRRLASCTVLAALACSITQISTAQSPQSRQEVLVNCPILIPDPPRTPYGFAKASLMSLWEARNAVKDATAEINKATQDSDNGFTFLTAMMRSTKISTNHFICAKKSIAPFASTKTQLTSATSEQIDSIRTAARVALLAYDQHLDINRRLLELLKKGLEKSTLSELSDQISTLQVERGERWSDLVVPTTLALMLLVDQRATDENGNFITATESTPGQTRRLTITKKQKQELLDWANDHFPELRDGTPEDQVSDPAKDVTLYFKLCDGRKGSDE